MRRVLRASVILAAGVIGGAMSLSSCGSISSSDQTPSVEPAETETATSSVSDSAEPPSDSLGGSDGESPSIPVEPVIRVEPAIPVETVLDGEGSEGDSSAVTATAETESGSAATTAAGTDLSPKSADDGGAGVLPSTRRTAAGLPAELTGYAAWYSLTPPAGGTAAEPPAEHLDHSRTYIRLTEFEDPGSPLASPLDTETIVVRESKRSADEFIRRLDVMTRTDDGWEFASFVREAPAEGFDRAAATQDCAACHSRAATTDSIFSELILRD